MAIIFLPLLAWKWRVDINIALISGIVIGGLTGLIVSLINTTWPGIHMVFLVIIEFMVIIAISAMSIIIRFYRDPERYPGETEGVILSPADGKVVYVNNVEKGSSLVCTKGKRKYELSEIASTDLLTDTTYLVGIDMNILNVHVNRSPIEGEIILQKRTKGKFISLRKQESETLNERVTTVIDNRTFTVGVIQISSRLVRKIISYLKEGENLSIGQRIGAIVFGSQVDIAIPELENLEIKVKPGDELKAGVSVIARYSKKQSYTGGGD
jgi:phosphatidylserine decarboxylase